MACRLIVAPASAGKTAFALDLARRAASGLASTPVVVVATHLQARSCRRRLAQAGGSLGVRVMTFYGLYAECLDAAGKAYIELAEPVRYRLIRAVVDALPLKHYAPLVPLPGFVQVLAGLIAELKTSLVAPRSFAAAMEVMGSQPRLAELARIYSGYLDLLQSHGWADGAGVGWLALAALETGQPQAETRWPLVVVDGFDDFSPLELALLRALAARAADVVITLTGTADGSLRPQAHRRSARTQQALEAALGLRAESLPDPGPAGGGRVSRSGSAGTPRSDRSDSGLGDRIGEEPSPLSLIEQRLFCAGAQEIDAQDAVELTEAPDRPGEAREALRWLKARIVLDGMRPGETALLARDTTVYRPAILEAAAEFGLPVRLEGGLPLRTNPAVASLLELLRLSAPARPGDPQPAMPRRQVVEAWRSPYFDWTRVLAGPTGAPPGALEAGADALDAAARWGHVIGGLAQWREVLDRLAARSSEEAPPEEELGTPAAVPRQAAAASLLDGFDRFARCIAPPQGGVGVREYVRWVEELVGPDDGEEAPSGLESEADAKGTPHLGIVARARQGPPGLAERDIAALRCLKEVLRGLVWADELLGAGTVPYARFLADLTGAVDAASYDAPARPERDEIVVASVVQARGVAFRAVALLGLAEGEFPTTVREDAFLTDADREALRLRGVGLERSTESAESEFFYQAVTSPRERLLITRPRLSEGGAPWPASPFWEEILRLVQVQPVRLTGESPIPPDRAASWTELIDSLASGACQDEVRSWIKAERPERLQALETAAAVLRLRSTARGDPAYDGDLGGLAGELGERYGTGHTWSASRLEAYRGCPFSFFVGSALGLEPRQEPEEGLDVAQRGTLYHQILEHLYQHPSVRDPLDLDQLLGALPSVAGDVLDGAPLELGFRETAWWAQTRAEMVADLAASLERLVELPREFVPCRFEARFGLEGQPSLEVRAGGGSFLLHGVIDRIDRSADGRVRVIDYKSGGSTGFTLPAILEGKKLQLPLYALAARDALGLGEPVEGFYWHVRKAEPSPFRLSAAESSGAVLQVAANWAWEAIQGVRAGHFVPRPPDEGCPPWCPAASFCWHLRPRFEG